MDLNNLSSIEKKKLTEIAEDPVKWAQVFVKAYDKSKGKYLPWIARWYQVEMLRDQSTRKVARCGRRTGKCLPPWIKILDPTTGERISIGELYKKQEANVLTMNSKHKMEKTKTNIVIDNGIKEVFKVELESGRKIDATSNHPLYTKDGWREVGELSIGEEVARPNSLPYFGSKKMNKGEIKELAKQSSFSNKIPDIVYKLNKEDTKLFIKEVVTASNNIIDSKFITIDCAIESFLIDIQHLLLKFGVESTITLNDKRSTYSLYSYQLSINSTCSISELEDAIDKVIYEDVGITWEKVTSVGTIGEHQTYDFTIPETHNFVANDIITHNTETMCIDMLHKTNKNTNFRCLVATPYESQVRLIFDRLGELIDSSPLLKNELSRKTSSPFIIEWKNGSSIVGFTTGAASGSGAASIIFRYLMVFVLVITLHKI